MGPERWKQVQDILLEALEKPDDERGAFLDTACGNDDELRAEVESLLAADGEGDVLDATLDDLVLLLDDDTAGDDGPPAHAGPYRLREELGRGGMGVVYRAERDDDQYSREVALKVVGASGVSNDDLARRFSRERQILAGLEHPHIARLYDSGITDDRHPWLAMELVRGVPIHTYCDEARLTVGARLRLFEQVLTAVDYAHRNLVVHRDLKPSNILVTEDGQVKLLDFGIAKLLDAEPGPDGDDPLTRLGQRILTPEYASPEQLDGKPITTASDVYALGVLLHQLLTGRRPDVDRVTRDTTRAPSAAATGTASASEASTEPPEARAQARGTTPDRLRRALKGELDAVLLTALSAEPSRRYPSAAAFLDDLIRYREGRALTARAPSFGYRAGKFIGRNRVAVTAATAAVVALVVGLGAALRQAEIARGERDVAESVSGFLEDLFTASNPFEPDPRLDTLRIPAFLDRAVLRLDTALAEQPAVHARMQRILGSVYGNIGMADQARPLLEASLEAHRAMGGDDNPEIGRALMGLGRAAIGAGDLVGSEAYFREALELAIANTGEQSRLTADLRLELAGSLLGQDRLPEAEELIVAALAVRQGAMGEVSPTVTNNLNLLGSLQYRQGKLDAAIATMYSALEMNVTLLGEDHPQTAVMTQNLGLVLHRAGRSAEAEPLLRASIDAMRAAMGPDYPQLGPAMKTLANALDALDRWDEAEPLFVEATAFSRRVQGDRGRDVAVALHDYGLALTKRGEHDRAQELLEEAVALERATSGPESAPVGVTLGTLGEVYRRRGDAAGAEAAYRESLRILGNILPLAHPRVLAVRGGLGKSLQDLGRTEEAGELLLSVYEDATTVEDGGLAARSAAADLRDFHQAAGDSAEAEVWGARAEGAGGS